MTDRSPNEDEKWRLFRQEPDWTQPALSLEIVVSRRGPAECTIYPRDETDFEETGAWIRAEEGSFESLEDVQ